MGSWFWLVASEALVSAELWEAIAPYLPPPRARGGRPRIPDRAALTGIVYVLRRGVRWRDLPATSLSEWQFASHSADQRGAGNQNALPHSATSPKYREPVSARF